MEDPHPALAERGEAQAALHETALGLISRLELQELLEAIVARAAQLLGVPHGFIYLFEKFVQAGEARSRLAFPCRAGRLSPRGR